MNKNSSNTEEILDAIKDMMLDKSTHHNQELPKDVIELTNPVVGDNVTENEKVDILELSNPINDENNTTANEEYSSMEKNAENLIHDTQIKAAVRNAIESIPSSKLDKIINEELTRIIQERLNSSKIIISTENKKN